MSKAYIIGRVRVTDPEAYKGYVARTPAAAAAHGGRFLVRGGEVASLEGPDEDRRIVVLEFPSKAALDAFWNSAAYAEAKVFRLDAAEFEAIAVTGVPDEA
jgi:uncharacterized protein (DUF1330 family)